MIINELRECSAATWQDMLAIEKDSSLHFKSVDFFMERVKTGLLKALAQPSPVFIVAHGGIHWVLCHLLNISNYNKSITHCTPVCFSYRKNNQWSAQILHKIS